MASLQKILETTASRDQKLITREPEYKTRLDVKRSFGGILGEFGGVLAEFSLVGEKVFVDPPGFRFVSQREVVLSGYICCGLGQLPKRFIGSFGSLIVAIDSSFQDFLY